MKVLAATLAVLLLVAICSLAQADPIGFRNDELSKNGTELKLPTSCCFSYVARPIPRRMIHSAYWTSNSCPMQAVVLVTKKGKTVCADPKAHWVQKYLEHSESLED